MALKSPAEKIKSSIGMLLFANTELLLLNDIMDWEELSKKIIAANRIPTGKTKNDYAKFIESILIAVCGYHAEIISQALLEYMKYFKLTDNNELCMLQQYFYLLRCALLHAEGELQARWESRLWMSRGKKQNDSTEQTKNLAILQQLQTKGLIIKIPIQKTPLNDYIYFEKSKEFRRLTFKIKLKHNSSSDDPHPLVRLNEGLVCKLILLSWHVHTITKKRTMTSLFKYLNRTIVKKTNKKQK